MKPTIEDNRSLSWTAANRRSSYVPRAKLEHDLDCDVAIVGGGFTGVSTAYHLARRFPERRIVLCEARRLGNGASGRSGGLVLNGVSGVSSQNLELARRVYETTRRGIDSLEARIREHGLDVPFRRDGCLEVFTDARRAEAAAREVERLASANIPVRFLCGPELEPFARFEGVSGAVLDATAGQIDGVRLLRAMRPVLEALGVHVHEETSVLGIEEGETHTLSLENARLRAKALVLATNAYTPQLGYFGSEILPLHSHVIATQPLAPGILQELGWLPGLGGFSDDRDRTSYGSLTERGELVFGGGSNAAYGYGFGNKLGSHGDSARASAAIFRTFERYFPKAGALGIEVRERWSGPVALTFNRVPTMGVRGKHRNVYFALGYSGHGITLSNLAGEVLSDLLAGDAAKWQGLPFFQQKLGFIPPEPFRWLGYHAFTALTGRSPRRA